MESIDTTRLLIIHDSLNEAERIISLLRNSGRAIRPQHVLTEEDFIKAVTASKFDLILAQTESEEISPDTIISQIKLMEKDIPVLLLQDTVQPQDVVEGLRLGAKDVICEDEDLLLLLVIERELVNLANRRSRRIAERRLKETEKRCELLLDSSMDAIAYIHDGMHIHANPTYVSRFGYESDEEISCISILDLVSSKDINNFKKFLKDHTGHGNYGSAEFSFQAVKSDSSTFNAKMVLSPAEYDEEPCTQVLIRQEQSASEEIKKAIQTISSQDLMTGLSNRPHFTESVEHAVSKALNSGAGSAIIYITIDNLNSIQSEVSLAAADLVLGDVAMLLRREVNESHPLARFADDVFTILLPEGSPRTVLVYASGLATKIEDNISQADGQTLQATCSIGIAMINDNTDDGKTALAKAFEAANTARTMDAARGCVFLYEEESENTDEAKHVMAKKLEVALNAGQFKLLFQPIISLRGSGNRYYEVLLRMVDESGTEISPNHFLEHAEKLQVTAKLDKWVIIQALKLLSEDIAKGNETHLIINLTASSLQDQSFVPWIQNALKAANVAASQLIFQFNEADAGNFLNDAKEISKALSLIKCECVLSRFGCSLKPFNLLKHLKVKFVKIDGSYTLDIQNHNEDPKSLINLIKELHTQEKHTIVPFVENASVLSTLWQAGAHYIQGHYLQAPSAKMDYDFSSDN